VRVKAGSVGLKGCRSGGQWVRGAREMCRRRIANRRGMSKPVILRLIQKSLFKVEGREGLSGGIARWE